MAALEPPRPDPEGRGYYLDADYWANVLSPPFFKKFTFGPRREWETPVARNLVWAIPSPPDFHHYNQIPRLAVDPPAEQTEKIAAAAH